MKKHLKTGALLIANAIIWAALTVVTGEHLAKTATFGALSHYFLAGWFASHMLIVSFSGSLRSAGYEWRCLRRKLSGG